MDFRYDREQASTIIYMNVLQFTKNKELKEK